MGSEGVLLWSLILLLVEKGELASQVLGYLNAFVVFQFAVAVVVVVNSPFG
jgi:hypothetical protein